MNARSTARHIGLHTGEYSVHKETSTDVTVTAVNAAGETVVVGRFPLTNKVDARAQAKLYAAAPHLVAALMAFLTQYPDLEENEHISGADMIDFMTKWARGAREALIQAGIEP